MGGEGGGVRFTAFQDYIIHTLNPYRLSPALKTTPRNTINNIDDMHMDCKDKNHFQCMQT